MLEYLYTSDYCDGDDFEPEENADSPEKVPADEPKDEERSISASSATKENDISKKIDEPSLLINVFVYAIAEKYDIVELKEMAKAKFQDRVGSLLSATE